MARPPARPLTELAKYRLDLETRAWVERMRQQPTKAREPHIPIRPYVTATSLPVLNVLCAEAVAVEEMEELNRRLSAKGTWWWLATTGTGSLEAGASRGPLCRRENRA